MKVQYIALVQHLCDLRGVYPMQIHLVYTANHLRALLIDNKRTIHKVIAQWGAVGAKLLTFYPLLIAPAYIAGDGLTFCLCEGCVQGGHQFRRHPCGINVLLLEEDGRTVSSELPDGFQAFCRVTGEAGDGLDQNAVDESAFAVGQHPLEILSLLHRGAGDALVSVDVHQPPVLMLGDVLRIVDVLGREGVELILRGGAHPAVSGHPQLLGIPFMVGFDPDDPPLLAVQGKVSVDLFLFRGRSPPPCSNTTYHSHLVKATAFCEEIQKEIGIVAPVCTAIRAATCSSSALGKPAFFSAAKRFRMPQKSTFLSCMIFSFYMFSDGTNTGAVERGNGVVGM